MPRGSKPEGASKVVKSTRKPPNAGKGRKKGVPNKTTKLLKECILIAGDNAGGEKGLTGYLTVQAVANPVAFMGLLGRVLPLQVNGAGPAGSHLFQVITGVPRDGD